MGIITKKKIITCFSVLLPFLLMIACQGKSDVKLDYTPFSSDSEHIYFLDKDNKWVIDNRWGKDKYAGATISPSGKYLAFQRFPYGMFVVKNSEGITLVEYKEFVNMISWHPKETHIACIVNSDICIFDIQAKKMISIYPNARLKDYPSPPSWNGNGDKLFFVDANNKIIAYDLTTNKYDEVTKGKGVHYLSDTELVVRGESDKYYIYNLKTKGSKYLFKLGGWEYPPIFLSPDKKVFLTWDTMPRKLALGPQGYTLIREFPSGKKLRTTSGAHWFSWTKNVPNEKEMRAQLN
jgi:hypothetical protein